MSDERHGRWDKSQALAVLATVCLLMLPLYVLSTGPVVWLLNSGIIDEKYHDVIMTAYLPLVYLYDHFKPAEAFFDWYIGLFGVD
jgi:hypothetical protein